MVNRILESRRLARHGAGARRPSPSASAARRRNSTPYYLGVGRPGLRAARTRSASGARSPRCSRGGRRATARSPASSVARRPRHPGRDQLHRHAAEQALGPDGQQAVQPVGPEPQRAGEARRAAADPGLRAGARVPALPRPAEGVRVRRRSKVTTEYIDPDKKPTLAQQNQVQQYGTIVFNYKGRTERVTSDTEQDITNGIIKVVTGQQRKVYFTQGHGEKDTTSSERDGYNDDRRRARPRELHRRQARARPAGRGARRCVGRRRRRAADRLLPARDRRAEEVSRQGRQAAAGARSAGQGRQRRRSPT